MTDENRRRFIQAAGGLTLFTLAGCTGIGGSDDSMDDGTMGDDTTTEDGMDDGTMDDGTMGDDTTTEDGMDDGMEPTDPSDAPRASIDRFSESAGTLHVRGPENDLPGPDEAIDFDRQFLAQGFGPDGSVVQYYDFDVQPTTPAPIYAFFDDNGDPIEGQLNVVGVVPGDDGYNDFWQVNKVTVPDEYEANTITSAGELMDGDFDIETTGVIKNCPIVPEGSTASMRHGDGSAELVDGWYDGEVVSYFLFEEAPIEVSNGSVPRSPIFVTFNVNPGEDGGGPPSGFATEMDGDQTHNVVATVPGDAGYSPLWQVTIYDNADFENVTDIDSARNATILATDAANVNCPIVSVE